MTRRALLRIEWESPATPSDPRRSAKRQASASRTTQTQGCLAKNEEGARQRGNCKTAHDPFRGSRASILEPAQADCSKRKTGSRKGYSESTLPSSLKLEDNFILSHHSNSCEHETDRNGNNAEID